jgi:uncharacterized membrane-anchored protein
MSTSHGATALPPEPAGSSVLTRRMLNKVPEITLAFWVVKVLCTTVAQGAADLVEDTLGFGVANAIKVFAAVLAVLLLVQLRLDRYVPVAYWLVAGFLCVLGTLVVDAMTDGDASLAAGTAALAALFVAALGVWWSVERTLSLDTVVTTRREAFYWLAILLGFAVGTSAGAAFVADAGNVEYAVWIGVFGVVVALIALAHHLGANAVLTFWLAFVATSPLGAALGEELAQSGDDHGGLGLGATSTCTISLVLMAGLVAWLTVVRRRREPSGAAA